MELTYTTQLPNKENLYTLYDRLGWNAFLKLSKEQLLLAMKQSWYAIYVYHEAQLIATGRIVSDGVINAYLCGLGVDSEFREQGIGTEIVKQLVTHCQEENLHIQFFCEDHLIPYYTKMGFEKFATGLTLANLLDE